MVATLKPSESGGTEHNVDGSLEETIPSTSTRGDPKGVGELSTGAKTRTGYGRILRDEEGNAVDIQLVDEEDWESMDTDRNVETMDGYLDEKSATTWTQLGAHRTKRAKRPRSVVEGMGRVLNES